MLVFLFVCVLQKYCILLKFKLNKNNSIIQYISLTFISSSLLSSDVAWLTSCGVNRPDLMGVLDLGVLGRLLPGEGAQLLAWELEFRDTELLPK